MIAFIIMYNSDKGGCCGEWHSWEKYFAEKRFCCVLWVKVWIPISKLPGSALALFTMSNSCSVFSTQRRRHLRKLRILPQSISNNTEEELTTFVLKSSKTDNSSHTAVSINSQLCALSFAAMGSWPWILRGLSVVVHGGMTASVLRDGTWSILLWATKEHAS